MNWTRFFAAFFAIIGGFGTIIAYSLLIEWVTNTISPMLAGGILIGTFLLPLTIIISIIIARED